MSKFEQLNSEGINRKDLEGTAYCWDCGWSGSPRKALNKHVNAVAMCPKCHAGLRNRSLKEVLKENNGVLPRWLV